MRASVVTVSNPFRPERHRRVAALGRRRRIRALAPRTRQPFIAILNGRPVLRAEWRRKVRDGDVLVFITLPQGGGGGSNPLRLVLMLAVAFFAPYAAAGLNASLGLGLGATGLTALSAGVALTGNMLVNTLIPTPRPPTPQLAQAMAAPSPTYSLSAQGNNARIDAPIPVLYGRNMVYCDFAAQPYSEYGGNEQYLFSLLVLGQGEYDIESLRIDDTVIESAVVQDGAVHTATGSFDEIDYQIVPPGGTVTLFPSNVVSTSEVSGQELTGAITGATYTRSGSATVTVNKTAHGLAIGDWFFFDALAGTAADGIYQVATAAADSFTFTHASSGTDTAQSCNLLSFIGPYVVNAAGTVTNTIAVDYVMPRGLYYAETDGRLSTKSLSAWAVARTVDDGGTPTGAWTTLGTLSHSAATTTPQRISAKYAATSARYQVMVARTDAKDTSTQAGHELAWASARAYLPGSQAYGDLTLIALRMRATNNLSNLSARKVNAICTRKLPIWDGTAWSANTATRSIAWAIADIVRADYGGRRADARIDLDGLLALDAVWTARGDRFDAIMDTPTTVWEALTLAAKAGRAAPVEQGGILHVVRDSAQTLPTQMFSVRNIARGSMRLEYTMPSDETADAVDVEYWDDAVWQPRTVRAALPGSSEANVAKLRLFGVSDRDQAWREGMYIAAANRYRRRHVTFSCEMEGLALTLGDLIAIQHDMPRWGQAGEVVDWDGGYTLTPSEPLDFSAGGQHYISFRRRDGSADGPYTCYGPGANNTLLVIPPPTGLYVGGAAERTHYAFGPADSQYITARVVSVRPRSSEQVEVSAVVESEFVHTADTGATPSASAWQLSTRITRPVLLGLMARSSPDAADNMFLSWQASPGAEHYLIEISDSGNGWTRIGETRGTTFTGVAMYGARTIIRVAPVGLTMGHWVEVAYGSSASYMWDPVGTTLMWDTTTAPGDGSAVNMWNY